jgi:hypothetical protein
VSTVTPPRSNAMAPTRSSGGTANQGDVCMSARSPARAGPEPIGVPAARGGLARGRAQRRPPRTGYAVSPAPAKSRHGRYVAADCAGTSTESAEDPIICDAYTHRGWQDRLPRGPLQTARTHRAKTRRFLGTIVTTPALHSTEDPTPSRKGG